jgi:hypothetical protein
VLKACTEMKITIGAFLFAKWNMDINTCHATKVSKRTIKLLFGYSRMKKYLWYQISKHELFIFDF